MPNVAFKRPEVKKMEPKWALVRDCLGGEQSIKAKRETYLPKPQTSGDVVENNARYEAYLKRAVFYNVTGRTLEGLAGQVFSKSPSIEFPSQIDFLKQDIDGAGTTLEQQSKGVLHAILATGRAGLLSDFPVLEEGRVASLADVESGRIRPRVLSFDPEQIINWRQANVGGETFLTLLVLEESAEISEDPFAFKVEPHWRVFQLINPETPELAQVQVSVWRKRDKPLSDDEKYEVISGPFTMIDHRAQPLRRVPFQFIGARNNDPEVDEPPLYNIASLNISHYRNSADVEESSFLVGQPTPVFAGLEQGWVDKNFKGGVFLGSRSAIPLPKGGSALLLQAAPNSMPQALMKDKEEQMKALGAKLIENKKVPETATGAAIEETSEASVLSSAANNVAQAYGKALWFASGFLGDFQEEAISFELNTDFDVARMTAQERAQLVAEWQGELLTWEEARSALRTAGIAYLDDKEARSQLETEAASRGDFKEEPQNLPGV
jgi:hypothetical protein